MYNKGYLFEGFMKHAKPANELETRLQKRNSMAKPTYDELLRKVEELEKMVSFKISPQEFYFDTRDLIYFKGYRDWSLDLYDRKIEDLTGYELEDFLERRVRNGPGRGRPIAARWC